LYSIGNWKAVERHVQGSFADTTSILDPETGITIMN